MRDVIFRINDIINDIPNAIYEVKIIGHLVEKDPKKVSSSYDFTYSEVTKVSIINDNMLEIVQAFHEKYPEITYIKLENIEWYKLVLMGDTD